ncbi:MAG TPA: alkaline phosphatase family protein [Anaerolineales bacterium]|nr:alkaline phosphatase family protein [Anaerolineales bacterium]
MTDRLLVLGLDSAPLQWIQRWVDEGRLPHLGRLMSRSATGVLESVFPPLSPAAWSSFATGMLPGKHGVFDHIRRLPGTYDIAPTSARTRAGRAIWEIISAHGGRVGVVNVPETYPPMPVNGFMLSGMDTPSDDAEFAYPGSLKAELEAAVGGYKVFGPRSKESLDRSIAGMHETIPMRARVGRYLWETYAPEFMILVFMETDVIQHKCWKYMDPAHPDYDTPQTRALRPAYADAIPDVYSHIDSALGPWLDSLDEDTTVIVLSDHGAGPLRKFLYLNNWLAHNGYICFRGSLLTRLKRLSFRLGLTPTRAFEVAARLGMGLADRATNRIKRQMTRTARTTLMQRAFLSWTDVDWSRTRAYALGGNFTGIYVNLKGREPQGCVSSGEEYEALCSEIAARLRDWRDPDTGEAIVQATQRGEASYQGPFSDRAPDIVFTTLDEAYVGFGGHEFASTALMEPSPMFNGHHRVEGMISLSGRGVRPGRLEPSRIVDVAPTILHLLGYPIPSDMDGRVVSEALSEAFLDTHPIRQEFKMASLGATTGSGAGYTTTEEQEVISRLEDLGYL